MTVDWLKTDMCHIPSDSLSLHLPQLQRLVVMDIFTGPKTKSVFSLMKELDITAVYIPDGCTGYVQLMDTSLNKLVKDKVADIQEESTPLDLDHITVGQRRIAIIHAVAACKWVVWEVLSKGELLPHDVILRGYY